MTIDRIRQYLPGCLLLLCLALVPAAPGLSGQAPAETITRQEMLVFLQQEPQNALLVDVRPVEEFVEGHLPGAVNIPLERVARVLPRLQKYERIIFYCNFGFVSEEAQTLARQSGLQQTRYLKKTVRVNPDGSFEIR